MLTSPNVHHVYNLAGTSGDLTTGFSYNPANQITLRTRSNTAFVYGGDVDVARSYAVNGPDQYLATVSNGVTTVSSMTATATSPAMAR